MVWQVWVKANMQPKLGQIVYAGCNFMSDVVPFFRRRPQSCYARLARIRFRWPGQILAKHIWSSCKPACKKHCAWFWQNATSLLPVSCFHAQLHSSTDGWVLLCRTCPGSDLVLADCVRFLAKQVQSRSKPACKNDQACSGQCFPHVTAVAHKRPRSSCQKGRWQVTAKHTYTLRMWLCMKWHGAWLYGVHRTRRDWLSGSRFLWHQPCQRCKYTTSVDIQKCAIKTIHSCRIICERSESARERRTALYKSD